MLEQKVGRLIINGYPTGVEVCHALVHGGPFPATAELQTTSVGTGAITRFTRPLAYQNFPTSLLPPELQDGNPLDIFRLVNGEGKKNEIDLCELCLSVFVANSIATKTLRHKGSQRRTNFETMRQCQW